MLAPVQCIARFQSVNPVSIIMVADDGTFSGTSEAVYILNTLKGQLKAPANSVPCQQLYTGTLLGQKVVVAISGELLRTLPCITLWAHRCSPLHLTQTQLCSGCAYFTLGRLLHSCCQAYTALSSNADVGIGPEASALCTTYITQCADLVKDFIYLGTSGWSAQKGGILNAPSSCAAANGPTARTSERLYTPTLAHAPLSACAAAWWPCARKRWPRHTCVQAPLGACAAAAVQARK